MDNVLRILLITLISGSMASFLIMFGIVINELNKEDIADKLEREERRKRK